MLEAPCDGILEASSVTVGMDMSGPGVEQWLKVSKREFSKALTADIAHIIFIPERHVTSIKSGSQDDPLIFVDAMLLDAVLLLEPR